MLAVEMTDAPACYYRTAAGSGSGAALPGSAPFFGGLGERRRWLDQRRAGVLTGLVDWEDAVKAATRFFHLNSTLPDGRTGTAAFANNPEVGEVGGGTCTPGGDYSGSHTLDSPPIVIPAGATAPLLSFDHWVATEAGVDGGQVEVSRNGGAWTLVPQSQYVYNPPNNVFNQAAPVGNNTGPNPGEDAWTGINVGRRRSGSLGDHRGQSFVGRATRRHDQDSIQLEPGWVQWRGRLVHRQHPGLPVPVLPAPVSPRD